MATNIIRKLYHTARHAALRAYVGYRSLAGAVNRSQNEANRQTQAKHKAHVQEQKLAAMHRRKATKARVQGVKKVTRSVTKGTRKERADQLRAYRRNPNTRATLRKRVKFYTV